MHGVLCYQMLFQQYQTRRHPSDADCCRQLAHVLTAEGIQRRIYGMGKTDHRVVLYDVYANYVAPSRSFNHANPRFARVRRNDGGQRSSSYCTAVRTRYKRPDQHDIGRSYNYNCNQSRTCDRTKVTEVIN